MSRTERRSSAKRVFLALAFVLCLTGAAALGLMAWFQWRPLARAEAAYEAMRQTGRTSGEEMDWAGLQGQYPGIVGWLSAPDAGIDYPVMQGADNSYYLTHLPDGSYNAVGSVFMDAANAPRLTDPMTILYGHHVGGGKMFSPLVKYRSEEFLARHPVMTYLTPEKTYSVEIFAAHEADGNESAFLWAYSAAETPEDAAHWLARLAARSDISGEIQPQPGQRLLALVTCSSLGENAPRYIVYGILKEQPK